MQLCRCMITNFTDILKGKGSLYSITERRVSELIPVLGSQPAGDVNHKPGGRLPLLSARPAVTLATLKRAVTNFTAWWTEALWVWTVCLSCYPTASRLRFEPGPFCAWVQHANHSATEPPILRWHPSIHIAALPGDRTLRTRYANRLNPEENRGIRNVPLPEFWMLIAGCMRVTAKFNTDLLLTARRSMYVQSHCRLLWKHNTADTWSRRCRTGWAVWD